VHVHVLLVTHMMVVDSLARDPSDQISIWPSQNASMLL